MPFVAKIRALGGIATSPDSYFRPKRQSPIDHLKVLRGASHEARNTDSYLSPALHNSSDTWARFLRAQSYRFCDEHGVARNHALLMRRAVQERQGIHKWCESIKADAGIFTLIHRDIVSLSIKKAFERQAAESSAKTPPSNNEKQDEFPADANEGLSTDFKGPEKDLSGPSEGYSTELEEEDQQVTCDLSVEDWSAEFDESDGYFAHAIEYSCDDLEAPDNNGPDSTEDWSDEFEVTQEQFDSALQHLDPSGTDSRPNSSCSSLSANNSKVFDTDKVYLTDDEMSIIEEIIVGSNMCKEVTEIPSVTEMTVSSAEGRESTAVTTCLKDVDLPTLTESASEDECSPVATAFAVKTTSAMVAETEKRRLERLQYSECLLACAWLSYENRGYCLSRCAWEPVESRVQLEVIKSLAATSPVPIIQLTTPEGEVCDLYERMPALPSDFDHYVYERDAAQGHMAHVVQATYGMWETYSEHFRRIVSESWWKEREEETAREMELEEAGHYYVIDGVKYYL